MSNNSNNDNIITLEHSEELKKSEIVEDFIFEINTKNFVLDLNHEYKNVRIIWHYNKNWTIMKSVCKKECENKGVKDKHIPSIEDTIDLNYNSITATQENYYRDNNNQQDQQHQNPKDKEKDDDKKIYTIYKYSQGGIPLAESILVNNTPCFIQTTDGKLSDLYKKIKLADIDIVPPERTEYLSKEYNFVSEDEVQYFFNLAKQETLDSLFKRVKTILKKYIDMDNYDFINILTADIIFTYFQDKLGMTHYLLIIGDNNTGKSNILLVFSHLGYRTILDTAITPANIYNFGSQLEEGQCTIIEDEIDDIDFQDEKKKLYKVSYRSGTKVTRMYDGSNNNSSGPNKKSSSRQQSFFLFGFKMFASEKMPDKVKSKGFLERIIPLKALPGDPEYDIAEVVDNSGDEKFKGLYEELMNTRKLLLMYRLLHYDKIIPDIKLNIKNRYKQLTKPVIRLFQNTETALKEITNSLSKYLIEKNQEKMDSMDAAILTFIINLVSENSETLYNDQIWNELKKEYPNGEIEDKKYSWYLEGYGSISKQKITDICETKFGAKQCRDRDKGRGLVFNQNTLNKLSVNYSIIDGIKIIRDRCDTCDTFTESTSENTKDITTKNGENVTNTTPSEGESIPKNDNKITKFDNDKDTKTNGCSPNLSHLSQVSQVSGNGKPLFNNPLISDGDLNDPTGYQYDPEIINNIDRFGGNSDTWYCKKNKCKTRGDKWDLMKHDCKYRNIIESAVEEAS
jgi:hypothetical protein